MKKTFELKPTGTLNQLGFGADSEINRGKSEVQDIQYTTLTQQIHSMFNAEALQTNILGETTKTHYERDENDIDIEGILYNQYKANKFDTVEIGRTAMEKIDKELKAEGETK